MAAKPRFGTPKNIMNNLEICPYCLDDEQALIDLWVQCHLVVPANNPKKDIERKLKVNPDLFLVAVLGPSLTNVMISVGLGYWGGYARVVRGQVLSLREWEFVTAAQAIGANDLRIMFRHILPNIVAPVIVMSTLMMADAILIEATLSFLGMGAQPPVPSWGSILSAGRAHMRLAPWETIFPGIAIMLTVLGFNLLGDGLRDALDPRLK